MSDQFLRRLQTEDVLVSTIGPGEVFGWSALVSPYLATGGAKALTPCRVVTIEAVRLRQVFEDDCKFGFLMTTKVVQVIRDRLRDLRIESLALAGT